MLNNLPLNWCECKFSDVCDIYTGNSINEQEKASKYTNLDSGYNYIGTKDINFEQTIDYENGVKIPFDNGTFKIAPKNTPLLCIEGGSAGRKLAFTEEEVCFGNKLCAFVSKNKITNLYIFYFLQSTAFRSIFSLNKNGLIGGVSLNKIKSLELYLPPLREQERIVKKIEALFQDIDEGVERLKSAQAQIKQYRQSVLKSAFEGKLYKTTDWKEVQLKDVCEKIIGGGTPSKEVKEYFNGTIPFMTVKDMISTRPIDTQWHITIDAVTSSSTNIIPADTIIIATRVGLGKILRASFDTAINQDLRALFLKKIINKDFTEFLLVNLTPKIISKGRGTTVKGISLPDLKSLSFLLPTLPEQQRIVEEIEKRFAMADKLEKAVNDGLEKAEKLKQSILKKAFAGKLVPQDPNDEPASILLERIKKENQSQTKGRKK